METESKEMYFSFLDEQMPNGDDAELANLLNAKFGVDLGDALALIEEYREIVANE